MGKPEDRQAQTILLLLDGQTQNSDEPIALHCRSEEEAKRKCSLGLESTLTEYLQCESVRTSGIQMNKTYSLSTPLRNLKNSAAANKQIDAELHVHKTQTNPANRLKASSRHYLDGGARTKSTSNVSYGNVINMQNIVRKLKKAKRATQKGEIPAHKYKKTDTSTSNVKLKIIRSPNTKMITPGELGPGINNKSPKPLSNMLKPSLPKLHRSVHDSDKKPFRKDVNENAIESSAVEGSHVWTPLRYEPSFKFRVEGAVTFTKEYYGGKPIEGKPSNDILPVSALRKSDLYHSCFPLLVETYSTPTPSRLKRHSRPPCSYRENLNEGTAAQARTACKHCSARHDSCTRNYCTNNSQVETKPASLDRTNMTTGEESQQKDCYENDEDTVWRHSATQNSKTCQYVSRMGEKAKGGKLKNNGSQKQNNDVRWVEQCTVKKQPSYCNVWKSIIKSRDARQSAGKGKLESEENADAGEAGDKSTQKWERSAPPTRGDVKNPPLYDDAKKSEMNLFANVVTEALGELTPSQFSSSIDADDSFDKRTTVKKISRFKSSRCLRIFLQQYPTEKEELYFPPHCCHSEVSDYASAVENGSMASYPLSQGCDNNDNWNNSEQDTSSQMTETPATPSTTTATAQSEGPATSTPQRPISHHASSDDLRTGAIANNVHQDCSVKGYEVIRLIARGTSYKFSKIFLANNRNNTAISPVEIVAYTQPYTYFLTSCYCNDSKASNRHPMLNRALDLPPHRNLVTLLHRFCSPLMVYQVAEHFPWPSLTDLISTTSPGWVGNCRRGLAEDTRRSIFKQICGGMEHLHLCGIVHGGLNCDNILVSDRLEVKLANYGPACQRLSMSYDPIRDRMSPRITPYDAYTPPEMMTVSGSWTRSCDVWCIGVVLLEMTLGEIPPSLNAAIRLSGSAKKVERVGLETCGYQLSLLIDKILQCRPSQRPHVSTLSQHAWLSDGTEMVVVVNKGSVKVSKRTDGSTFPLPKRLQNQMLPTSDAFYDNSDAESEAKNAPSDRTGGYSGGCQGETGDSRVAVTSSWNEKSSHSDVSASDDRHCMHSVSCNHCQPRPEGEKVGGGGESEIVEHRSYSKVLTLEEEFFGRLMTESSENKGFLSNLVESLDTMSNSGVTGYGDNRSGVPKHRRRANSHRLKEVNTHKNRTKRAKLTRRYSPPTTYLDYLSEFKTSPSQRDDRDGKGATWTGLYNKYLDSEYSASTSSHNDHEDSSTVFTFTDCSNEFVMEDDDKALEEIESMIKQEEKEFWGREYGRITVETK